MASCYAAAAKSPQSCSTLCDPTRRQPTRLPRPWDSPGKNTGVGCHFLLQCMKVKSESEVAQSCPTLSDPMDCSLPGSSTHGIFQARVLEWGAMMLCYMLATCIFFLWILCFEELSRLAQTALVHSFSCLEQHFSHFNKHNSHQGILLKYRF